MKTEHKETAWKILRICLLFSLRSACRSLAHPGPGRTYPAADGAHATKSGCRRACDSGAVSYQRPDGVLSAHCSGDNRRISFLPMGSTSAQFCRYSDRFNGTILGWTCRRVECNPETDGEASPVCKSSGQAAGEFLFSLLFLACHQLFARRCGYHVSGCNKNTILEKSSGGKSGPFARDGSGHLHGGKRTATAISRVLDLRRIDGHFCGFVCRALLLVSPSHETATGKHRIERLSPPAAADIYRKEYSIPHARHL